MNLRISVAALVFAVASITGLKAQIVLDNFDSGTAKGSIIGTSWLGQVTQHATTITVGGTAKDEQGWGATGLTIDATGMNFLTIVAQRDSGNLTENLNIQFYDGSLSPAVFSVPTSLFAVGTLTTVDIPVGTWGVDGLDKTNITDWSIGGGVTGTVAFHMTFDNLQLQTAASSVPEPSTYAAIMGFAVMGVAFLRRKKRSA